MVRILLVSHFLLCFASCLFAKNLAIEALPIAQAREQLGIKEAAILGLVEGLTEYLPVSSTGHLILTTAWLNLADDQPIVLENGQILTYQEQDKTFLYTTAQALDAYIIIIQGGAILAVLTLYWKTFLQILLGFLGRNPTGLRLGFNLILAFMPSALLGLWAHDWIMKYLFQPFYVAIGLIAGSMLIFFLEKKLNRRFAHSQRSFYTIWPAEALWIGVCQCLALWPGVSRSLATMAGGLSMGLSRAQSAAFSFLLGLVTLTAASTYEAMKSGLTLFEVITPCSFLVGLCVATLSAILAIQGLVRFLGQHTLIGFAYYRIGLALLVIWFL